MRGYFDMDNQCHEIGAIVPVIKEWLAGRASEQAPSVAFRSRGYRCE